MEDQLEGISDFSVATHIDERVECAVCVVKELNEKRQGTTVTKNSCPKYDHYIGRLWAR